MANQASDRKETIKEIRQLGEDLNKFSKMMKYVRVGAGLASVLASSCAVVRYFELFGFENDESLAPKVALTGLAVAVAVTAQGTTIVDLGKEKSYIEDAKKALDKDKDRALFGTLNHAYGGKESNTKKILFVVNIVRNFPGLFRSVTFVARRIVPSKEYAACLLKIGKFASVVDHTLAAVFLPVEIVFIVFHVIDLSKGYVSDAAKRIFEVADELEKEL